MRAPEHRLSTDVAETLADTFRVLGDPTRIRLIAAMAGAERCVGDLAATVGMSESAVSHQLRMLRAARLVRTRRAGRHIFYTLDDGHILTLFQQGLSHVREQPASAPSALRRGEPLPVALRRGEPLPAALRRGEPLPAALRRGEPVPVALRRGEPLPAALRRGEPLPSALRRGQGGEKA